MRELMHSIGLFVIGGFLLLLLTYLVVSLYAFAVWDWDIVLNLHHWLNPATNLLVRVGAIIGGILSLVGGYVTSQLG